MKLPLNDGSKVGDTQFPRTSQLPVQSPLYWVSQKDRYLRQLMIRDIEGLTGRRFIVWFANRFVEGSGIDNSDPAFMMELLSDLEPGESVDLMIETNGGMTDAAEAIIAILTDRLPDLRIVVANAAKSNGTLIALAGQEILMGSASELGPIDPQIQGTPCTILAKPEFAQMNFALHHLGHLALKQSQTLAVRLLSDGMMKGSAPDNINRVAQALASRDVYFSHGSTIDHREATALGLTVLYLPPDGELWQRIWLLYTMYEFDVRRDGYLKVFEGRGRSTAVGPS